MTLYGFAIFNMSLYDLVIDLKHHATVYVVIIASDLEYHTTEDPRMLFFNNCKGTASKRVSSMSCTSDNC